MIIANITEQLRRLARRGTLAIAAAVTLIGLTQSPVMARAAQAEQHAERHGRPLWVLLWAVKACFIGRLHAVLAKERVAHALRHVPVPRRRRAAPLHSQRGHIFSDYRCD